MGPSHKKLNGNDTGPVPSRPRVLFSSPCGPYPKTRATDDPIDYFYYRNTWAQGMFRLRTFQSWHPLHYLAQNLPVPSVVLENPSVKKFRQELKAGQYQVLAISFTPILVRRVLDMVTWARQEFPDLQIILGGYGTAVFEDPDETARALEPLADHICPGEGLKFMRDYLARHWQVNGTIAPQQDLVPAEYSLFRNSVPLFKQLVLVGALGCGNGCCFCATSSKFRKKKYPVLQGKQLFNTLRRQAASRPRVRYALIYEEDFLADRDKVLEFMAGMDACDELRERPLLLTVFATTRSLARYSITELIRCGIGTVFVGVESFNADVLQQEALSKRVGNVGRLFQTLHDHGINTLGSLIVGWDNQTAEKAGQDIAGYIRVNPTFYQVIPLHPVPGTPLWKDLKRQDRLLEGYRYEDDRVSRYIYKLKNYSADLGLALVDSAYTGLVAEGGPWPFRVFENLLSGYSRLSASTDPVLQNRARVYRRLLKPVLPLAIASRFLFSGTGFKTRWRRAMQTCRRYFPFRYWSGLLAGILYLPVLVTLYGLAQLRHVVSPAGDQPRQTRVEYNPVH